MCLITNKSPLHEILFSSTLGNLEEVGDPDLCELWSLMTTLLLAIIFILEGQLAAMCLKPKHLKHF